MKTRPRPHAIFYAATLALASCGKGEPRPRSGADAAGRRLAAVALISEPGRQSENAVPARVAEGLQRYAAKRLTVVRDAQAIADETVAAAKPTGACDPTCIKAVGERIHASTLVEIDVGRNAPDQCIVSVRLVAVDGERASEPQSASSACRLQDLERALEQAMRGLSELRGLATSPPPPHPACENVCSASERSCQDRDVLSCGDADWDGCNDWIPTPCPHGQGCSRGACVADREGMQLVGEGPFVMGSSQKQLTTAMNHCRARNYACVDSWWRVEQPAHWVYVSGFWIDRTEVTNAEYQECVRSRKCASIDYRKCRTWNPATKKWGPSSVIDAQIAGEAKPVVCITFDEAQNYCKFRGKRLPTEAEWEKAARGADGRLYPWGDDAYDGSQANGCDARCGEIAGPGWRAETNLDDKVALLAEVGSYPRGASPYGVLDMAGNVWEWVSDWYGENYYKISERKDPLGPEPLEAENTKVVRGGSWSNEPDSLRSSYRYSMEPAMRITTVGFRCAYP